MAVPSPSRSGIAMSGEAAGHSAVRDEEGLRSHTAWAHPSSDEKRLCCGLLGRRPETLRWTAWEIMHALPGVAADPEPASWGRSCLTRSWGRGRGGHRPTISILPAWGPPAIARIG